MLRFIEQKILQIRKAAGIEIVFLPGEKFHINATVVSLKKNKVVQEHSFIGLANLNELAKKLDQKIPVSVIFNGKGVLVKKLAGPTNNVSVQSIIPGANPADFYFESFSNNSVSIASMARKETVDKILEEATRTGFKTISVSFGVAMLNNIIPILELNNETFETDSLAVTLNDEKIISDVKTKEEINVEKFQPGEIKIADQYIKPSALLSFAAGVFCLTDDLKFNPPVTTALIVVQRSEWRYEKLFKAFGLGVLAFLLLILLINFFIYDNIFQKNQALQFSQLENAEQLSKLNDLNTEIGRKERFLQQSGWKNLSRTSYFADRVGSMTPASVLLTVLNINPIRTNAETEEPGRLFKKDTIFINGVCGEPADLNKFINNLKLIPDFRSISLKNYEYRNEKETGSFLIEAITKD